MNRFGIALAALGFVACGQALADYPPPQNATDQRCRQVAEASVFTEPNPQGLDLEQHGYRIWAKCMKQAGQAPAPFSAAAKGKGRG